MLHRGMEHLAPAAPRPKGEIRPPQAESAPPACGRISAVSAAGLRTLFTYFLTDDEPDSPFCVMRPLV